MEYIKSFILIFFLSSCIAFKAYFNTVYNAKKYFRMAEKKYFSKEERKLTQDVKSLYEKALEKYLRVIKYFPNSPFLDDAIFYSGLIYIRLEDKPNAIRKFEEISKYFPKSHFTRMLSDSLLEFLLEREDVENSFYILSIYPRVNSRKFYFYKAKLFEITGEYDSALVYAKKVLNSGDYLKRKVLPVYVKAALKLGFTDSALYYLETSREKDPELSLLLAEAHKEKGDYVKAEEIINSFDPENTDFDAVKSLLEIYKKSGDTSKMKKVIRNFIEKGEDAYEKQELAYELALILFKQDSLSALKNVLSEVKKFSPSTKYGMKASKWLNLIDKEEKLKEKKEEEQKQALLEIAESYYVDIGLYEKGVKLLDEFIRKFPDAEERPRVLYLIIFIYKNFLKDSVKTNEYFEILKNEYKGSFYYDLARNLLEPGSGRNP